MIFSFIFCSSNGMTQTTLPWSVLVCDLFYDSHSNESFESEWIYMVHGTINEERNRPGRSYRIRRQKKWIIIIKWLRVITFGLLKLICFLWMATKQLAALFSSHIATEFSNIYVFFPNLLLFVCVRQRTIPTNGWAKMKKHIWLILWLGSVLSADCDSNSIHLISAQICENHLFLFLPNEIQSAFWCNAFDSINSIEYFEFIMYYYHLTDGASSWTPNSNFRLDENNKI